MGPGHETAEAVSIHGRQKDVTHRTAHYGNGYKINDLRMSLLWILCTEKGLL